MPEGGATHPPTPPAMPEGEATHLPTPPGIPPSDAMSSPPDIATLILQSLNSARTEAGPASALAAD